MQTTRHRISAAAKLSAGMQHGKHNLDRRALLYLVLLDGNTATVVCDPHRAIRKQGHGDGVAVTGKRLINRVVDHLIHQVVEAAFAGRTDVHSGAFTYGFQSLKDGDVVCAV